MYLPQEFTGTNERSGVLELPTDNIGPLVQTEGQVTVTTDPTSVSCMLLFTQWHTRIHDSLRSGTNSDRLLQFRRTITGDPGDFRGETFNVFLFLLQSTSGNENGEVSVLHQIQI